MGLDMRRLVASPLFQRLEKAGSSKPGGLAELEAATGIVPGRDVAGVVVAGTAGGESTALVFGQFDLARIGAALDAAAKASKSTVRGVAVYSGIGPALKSPMSLALLDAGTLAIGPPARLEALLAARGEGAKPLLGNAKLAASVKGVAGEPTFWMVGDGNMTKGMPGGGAGAASMLPPLDTLVVTGDFAPELRLRIAGQAADAATAKQTSDMVRGLVAMLTMQAAQKPELQALASGLVVGSEGAMVTVSARIPYDVLDKLMPPTPPAKAATPVR